MCSSKLLNISLFSICLTSVISLATANVVECRIDTEKSQVFVREARALNPHSNLQVSHLKRFEVTLDQTAIEGTLSLEGLDGTRPFNDPDRHNSTNTAESMEMRTDGSLFLKVSEHGYDRYDFGILLNPNHTMASVEESFELDCDDDSSTPAYGVYSCTLLTK